MVGTIYFIQEMPNGPVKIGFTSGDVVERWHGIQTGNPREVVLIALVQHATLTDEARWHQRFHDCRCSGEWFYPTASLVAAIDAEAEPAGHVQRTRRIKRPPQPWAIALAEWMKSRPRATTAIADKLGLSQYAVRPIVKGYQRPTAQQAKIIENYTDGAVKASLLLTVVGEAA